MDTDKMAERLGDTLLVRRHSLLVWKVLGALLAVLLLVDAGLGWYWSREPALFDVEVPSHATPGQVTTGALIHVASTLLDKPGGYLSNDILPHHWWLDDMPNWEAGVLTGVRNMTDVLRQHMSRSDVLPQTQDDVDLAAAEAQFNFDGHSWAMPSSESEYQQGIDALQRYDQRLALAAGAPDQAHFYVDETSLDAWLAMVQSRLDALSQSLSNSTGRDAQGLNVAAGDGAENQRTTPWGQIDDVFFRARGECWALVEMMRAVEVDYAGVLQQHGVTSNFQQALQELEATQQPVTSPMILNGAPFGMLANHSLVMANYISRADASIIELRQRLQKSGS